MMQQNNSGQQVFGILLYFNIVLGTMRATKKIMMGPDFGEFTT